MSFMFLMSNSAAFFQKKFRNSVNSVKNSPAFFLSKRLQQNKPLSKAAMSTQIHWLLEVAILPGQLENFRAVARDLIASTKSEPGTLAYEWNLSENETVCHIYERYQNSDAALAHVKGFGAFAERFLQACRPTRFDIYGTPNEAVKAALADFGPVYFSPLGGFNR
jgi:quinol monooxygenase YgiN